MNQSWYLSSHRKYLFATKIMGQQGSQNLQTYYVLINHVQNPNRSNNQKNFQIAGREQLTGSRARMVSPWK
jgi:hypothetical protein